MTMIHLVPPDKIQWFVFAMLIVISAVHGITLCIAFLRKPKLAVIRKSKMASLISAILGSSVVFSITINAIVCRLFLVSLSFQVWGAEEQSIQWIRLCRDSNLFSWAIVAMGVGILAIYLIGQKEKSIMDNISEANQAAQATARKLADPGR